MGTTPGDLLPAAASAQTDDVLRDQAKRLFETVLGAASRDTLLTLNPYLARLLEADRKR